MLVIAHRDTARHWERFALARPLRVWRSSRCAFGRCHKKHSARSMEVMQHSAHGRLGNSSCIYIYIHLFAVDEWEPLCGPSELSETVKMVMLGHSLFPRAWHSTRYSSLHCPAAFLYLSHYGRCEISHARHSIVYDLASWHMQCTVHMPCVCVKHTYIKLHAILPLRDVRRLLFSSSSSAMCARHGVLEPTLMSFHFGIERSGPRTPCITYFHYSTNEKRAVRVVITEMEER